MHAKLEIKKQFSEDRKKLFSDASLLKNSFKFCVSYSILVEEYILRVLEGQKLEFALCSAGSFSRRELSPYSDIDLMFIVPSVESQKEVINDIVTTFWDCGIEVSHTVREFSDIEKFLDTDLHAFTQFFETRLILGNDRVYNDWNIKLFQSITEEYREKLLKQFFEDVRQRHKKFGDSPKVLEPNIKYSAGGLRDLHSIEWMYALENKMLLTDQNEITQTESFLYLLQNAKIINPREIKELLESYKLILRVRNLLHLEVDGKNDRLEFVKQEAIGKTLDDLENDWYVFMRKYFEATSTIHRFSKTMIKKFEEILTEPVSDYLAIKLDDDFILKDNIISVRIDKELTSSSIFRVFYYRGLYDARFDEHLRSIIIEFVRDLKEHPVPTLNSSVFFREILKLPRNVGKTLAVMNELEVLGAFLPEFRDLVGFMQPGVYHCYTADEHTIVAMENVEGLQGKSSRLGKLFDSIEGKDILYLAVLFHDIAKPISISGHEIIGGEIASTVMERLGFDQSEITLVQFLVKHHLTMEQVAFRRNLNDPSTLNNFAYLFNSTEQLDYLYILTYGDLSAVSPVIWTQWKADLLFELYRKTRTLIEERISGEELLETENLELVNGSFPKAKKENIRNHIESIDDLGYLQNYSQDEIEQHVDEIERGLKESVFYKEEGGYTNITVITRDSENLLTKLCGALSINDVNIHDAKIYTRKDGIVIDNFNVTDFRTQKPVEVSRYEKIREDLIKAIENELAIAKEFNRVKSKWWRIENKFFKRKGRISIDFEKHEKYTIIDVFSPDRLGLLYQISKKMHDLGLSIYFAKISTKGDDVVDSFYTLKKSGKKVAPIEYELIIQELTTTIEEML
ncbi:MAG: HD domain-containing protein [Melioribacteraceae bacterium]|nr:HD domain-containing protein [Melioribacteraceae bacterium]MCF8355716.1 HD domain-containing protein [Melioribacteraceae bacterium]MCF8394446.1 HD domain-containing protein [Melioribacteraceae bacterium]MCF8418580.1 HD domain-containing protein [Melioribacteraceae bacterium]